MEKSKKKSEENTEEKVKEILKEISDKKTIEDVVKNQKERIPGCGLADMAYSYDGGRTWTADSMHEVEENGNYQAAVRDAAGNITRLTVPVENIDRDPPEISFTLTPEPWQGGSAVLTVHAVDRGCGLDAKAFSFDNGRSFQTSGRKVIQEPGEIKVLVRDALGNFAHGYCRAVPLRKLEWTPPE